MAEVLASLAILGLVVEARDFGNVELPLRPVVVDEFPQSVAYELKLSPAWRTGSMKTSFALTMTPALAGFSASAATRVEAFVIAVGGLSSCWTFRPPDPVLNFFGSRAFFE